VPSVVDQVVRLELFPAEVSSLGFAISAAKGQEVPVVAMDTLGAQVLLDALPMAGRGAIVETDRSAE
jgi:hypothetical protein